MNDGTGKIRADGRTSGPMRSLIEALTLQRRRQLGIVGLLMLVSGLAELVTIGSLVPFLALLSGSASIDWPIVSELLEGIGQLDPERRLATALLLFTGAAFAAAAIRLLLTWYTQRFVLGVGHDLSMEIQKRVLLQPYSWHLRHNSSELIASLSKVELLSAGVVLQLVQAFSAAVIGLFIVVALMIAAPVVALSAGILFALLYWLIAAATRRRLRRNSAVVAHGLDARVRLLQECLGGIRDVILSRSQRETLTAFRAIDSRLVEAQSATAFIAAAPRFLVEAAGLALIALLTLVLAERAGGLAAALPALGAVALGAQRLLPLVQQLYRAQAIFAGNRAVADDIAGLLSLPIPAQEAPASKPLPFEVAIRCANLSFTYPDRQMPAVANVNLTIPKGARLAIVGPTGAGKSTLADLLMGLLEPSDGQVLVDDLPLGLETLGGWYANVAHVPQTVFLSDDSIARNIALGSPHEVSLERVRAAARTACIDGFIAELPEGYDTIVGERGVRLSGGQRQRLAIARAVYRRKPVLVLDEATSALDETTERALFEALDRDCGDVTLIVIAHRASTVNRCGIVARLQDGRLVDVRERVS